MTYQKVQTNFWINNKVRSWDFKTRMIALYLLTNQHRISEGLYRLPLSYIAEDLQLKVKDIKKAIERLSRDQFIKYDRDNSMILIINALKYQPLQNINHIKAAVNKLESLPVSPLLGELIRLAECYNPKFYNFLKKESKEKGFLKKPFGQINKKATEKNKGLQTNGNKPLKTKCFDSQALAQALTPTPAQTQAQVETDADKNAEIIFLNKTFDNNNLDKAAELTGYLISLILKNNSRASVPKKELADSRFKKWVKEIDKLHRLGPVGAKKVRIKVTALQRLKQLLTSPSRISSGKVIF
ncbi:hypothetical protein [Halanaerobium sp.]|uniref:hypothetical protein n=1 Tax=Halanaerobium sp. TaxID=1895664 RepID=UPI000DE6A672|nr:hypothetical protein [Halanaerobium sp.]PUU87754.1 MAG: hypothetical protein CI949_3400 [Halanaerobium sp.]